MFSYPMPVPIKYPRWKYHATEAPKLLKNMEEEQELVAKDPSWSDSYVPQAYPKMVFRPATTPKEKDRARPYHFLWQIVSTAEECDKAVVAGWSLTAPPRPDEDSEPL